MTAVKKERTTLTEKLGARKVRGLKYLLIAVPFIIYVFSFSYVPLMGWIYSVFDYKMGQPFLDFNNMVFIGLDNFRKLYRERTEVLRVLRNTLVMSGLGLLGSPIPVIFAIMFNEVRNSKFKKLVQTATTLRKRAERFHSRTDDRAARSFIVLRSSLVAPGRSGMHVL